MTKYEVGTVLMDDDSRAVVSEVFTDGDFMVDWIRGYDGNVIDPPERGSLRWSDEEWRLAPDEDQPWHTSHDVTEDRRQWISGAVRDTNLGKPRPDLISPVARYRLAKVMASGAEHYGDRNWEKGMPSSVFWESLNRHLLDYETGLLPDEDHLAQAAFNLFALMHVEGTDWDDSTTFRVEVEE